MTIIVLAKMYSIYRFDTETDLPAWIYKSEFYSITRTKDEISVVTVQNDFSENIICSRDWRILKVAGPLDFALTGIISGIANVLKDCNIPIFTLSTYDTDYILLKEKDLNTGINALRENGYKILE